MQVKVCSVWLRSSDEFRKYKTTGNLTSDSIVVFLVKQDANRWNHCLYAATARFRKPHNARFSHESGDSRLVAQRLTFRRTYHFTGPKHPRKTLFSSTWVKNPCARSAASSALCPFPRTNRYSGLQ